MRKAGLLTLVSFLVAYGCGGGSDESTKKAVPTSGSGAKTDARKGETGPAADQGPVAVITPEKVTAKVGEEVALTGVLLSKPKDVSRWLLAASWHYGDETKDVITPDRKKANIETVAKHAWKEKGTYTVMVKFWANNRVVAETSIQAAIK